MRTSASLLAAALAVSTLAGCRCGPGGTTLIKPDYQPLPTALSFEACPTKDENGAAVVDVFPDTKKVVIENRSKTGAGLKLSFTGANADQFKLDPAATPTAIDPNGSVELPIIFSPTQKGDLRAELVIDDEYDDTENVKVSLLGTGSSLPAQATLSTAVQVNGTTNFLTCGPFDPVSPNCSLEFPDTLFNEAVTLQVKIKNTGCPALKVTELAIESNGGDSQGFSIESPTQLPSTTAPMVLSTADGTDETTITIRFSPVDDASGNNGRFASLVIKSNDKDYGDGQFAPARLALVGNAIKPSIYTTPSFCNFSNAADPCGNATKVTDRAKFRITNDGSTPVTLSSTNFANGGAGGRFSIVTPVVGTTLQPTNTVDLDIAHSDMPLYVNDTLTVEATIPGQAVGSGGRVSVQLYGGNKPCLTTDPVDTMNFNNPTEELTAQTLRFSNGAACGTLVLSRVSIDTLNPGQPNPFFSLIDPILPPNVQVNPGAFVETTVQYKRPPSGGTQIGTLRVQSNDSDFGPPSHKLVQLISQSPLDSVPQAVLTGCVPANLLNDPECTMGSQTAMTVRLSSITPKVITLSGKLSTDNSMVKEYRFRLEPQIPGGVTTAALANHDQRITTPTTTLTLPSTVQGNFRISLTVWDDRGQQSGNASILNVNVLQ